MAAVGQGYDRPAEPRVVAVLECAYARSGVRWPTSATTVQAAQTAAAVKPLADIVP